MFLKRLYIHGFKSFAGVTKLDFEPGIVAIVGPNGSGKSNIADAIRWALGEQSVRNLRLKKGEEVVFAGTEKRAKASLAEVRLLLDNSDGAAPIDFSEIEISRLLYRSGETEYRLNGRKTPLREVQHLLAAAGFGLNSYAVIGQGMIDSMILATPAERKMLFDEASGIRQFEMKREASLRKLDATEANLTRVRDVLSELGPRLALLEKAAATERDREQLTSQLEATRATYIGLGQATSTHDITRLQAVIAERTAQVSAARTDLAALEAQRREVQRQAQAEAKSQSTLGARLASLEVRRDKVANQLSVKRAELQYLADQLGRAGDQSRRIAELEVTLADQTARHRAIGAQLKAKRLLEQSTTAELDRLTARIAGIQNDLTALRQETTETSQREYIQHALGILTELSTELSDTATPDLSRWRLMVHKAGRLLSHASGGRQAETMAKLKAAQDELASLISARETAQEAYTAAVITVRSLELDESHAVAAIERANTDLALLQRSHTESNAKTAVAKQARAEEVGRLEASLVAIGHDLARLRVPVAQPDSATDIFKLAADLEARRSQLQATEQALWQNRTELDQSHLQASQFAALAQQYGVSSSSLDDASATLPGLSAQLTTLEAKLAALPAEATAITEFESETERHTFLTEQMADLERATIDLRQVIASLEGVIKDRFELGFADIARHFTKYFGQLFGGGKAELTLKPGEGGEYGIEIVAMPPGKRMAGLAVLSGGERSMVGIALLAAILTVNPSPFVVLDEVDAALDEANSARFAKILGEMGAAAQLIVITHNRQTMQAAHSLFGVTMDAQHVSSLLSLRLEQAKELAAR